MSTVFMPKHIRPTAGRIAYNDCMLFNAMTPSELDRLDTCAVEVKYDTGDYLFRQNAKSDNVFNVISGTLAVERISSNGHKQIVCFLFPGDFFGITDSDHYDVAVRCLTKTELYKFNRKRLYGLAEVTPHLKSNIQHISSRIFSRIMDQLYILGQKKAHERLCFLFVQLLERMPGARPDRIELYMSRQDIADYLGLTIETISRSLAKLKSEKLIAFPSLNHLQILDLQKISEMAET